jgi:hypothetical protein
MTTEKDSFDRWWEWATKDRATDYRTIDAKIHNVVIMLNPEERAIGPPSTKRCGHR